MSLNDLSMHIVREEHRAANRSHAYMVNVSAGQINPPSPMRKYCCPMHYALNLRSPIYVFCVVPVWMFKLRFFQLRNHVRAVSLKLCTGGIEVPLCSTWLKHMYVMIIHGNPS